jgi:hypothetical protein
MSTGIREAVGLPGDAVADLLLGERGEDLVRSATLVEAPVVAHTRDEIHVQGAQPLSGVTFNLFDTVKDRVGVEHGGGIGARLHNDLGFPSWRIEVERATFALFDIPDDGHDRNAPPLEEARVMHDDLQPRGHLTTFTPSKFRDIGMRE